MLERPELASDERFATFADRQRNASPLIEILEELFAAHTSARWLEALGAAGVPSGPVNSVEQALADPQTAARELIVETDHPRFGTVRQLASPVRVGSEPPSYRRAPQRNEDADHVLRTLLGYDSARIAELTASGAFGSTRASA